MKRLREEWRNIDLKTKIAYLTAIIAFFIGWGLTIAAFFVRPIGIISDTVLWVLGQALVYTASILGVGMYVTGSVRNMKRNITHFLRDEKGMDDFPMEGYEDGIS